MKNNNPLNLEELKLENLTKKECIATYAGYPFFDNVGAMLHDAFCLYHNSAIYKGNLMATNYITKL